MEEKETKKVMQPKGNGVTFEHPVPRQFWNYITCDFQCHKDRDSLLPGIDYAVPIGTQITAGHGGTVIVADSTDDSAKGKYVVIRFHANGVIWEAEYLHLSKVTVRFGQKVTANSQIGRSGSTGSSTGPHLHWSIRRAGKLVNPERHL